MKITPLALVTLVAACSTPQPAPSPQGPRQASVERIGEPIARVNGEPIGSREFDLAAAKRIGRDGKVSEELKSELMQELLNDKLLYQDAVRRGIDLDPQVQKMVVSLLLKEVVYADVRQEKIRDEDLVAWFEEHEDEYVVPTQVHLRRLFVKNREGVDAKAKITELLARVQADPKSFTAVAQKESEGPAARRGGDYGYVTPEGRPGLPEEAVTIALELPAGGFSQPFEAAGGWNVVHVPDRKEQVKRNLAEVKGRVGRQVKQARYKAAYEAYLQGLRGDAELWTDEAWLRDHNVSSIRPVDLPQGERVPRDEVFGKEGR